MKFNNCYVAKDKDGGYLAIRDKAHKDVVNYVSLKTLGPLEQFVDEGGAGFTDASLQGAIADGELKIFTLSIGGNKTYVPEDGGRKQKFNIPRADILKAKLV